MKKFALLLFGIALLVAGSGCIVLSSGEDYGYHDHRPCDDDAGLRVHRR